MDYYEGKTRFLEQNICNLGYGMFESSNEYGIPDLLPIKIDDLENIPLQGFNFALKDKNPEGKGVHFFLHDYQFERVWNMPQRYADVISNFAFALSPDFSPYAKIPFAIQLFNVYRNRWVGRFWQERGIKVIPTVTWSDEQSLKCALCGVPKYSTIAISTMGEGRWAHWKALKDNWSRVLDVLEPETVLLYGKDLREELSGANIVYKQLVNSKIAV